MDVAMVGLHTRGHSLLLLMRPPHPLVANIRFPIVLRTRFMRAMHASCILALQDTSPMVSDAPLCDRLARSMSARVFAIFHIPAFALLRPLARQFRCISDIFLQLCASLPPHSESPRAFRPKFGNFTLYIAYSWNRTALTQPPSVRSMRDSVRQVYASFTMLYARPRALCTCRFLIFRVFRSFIAFFIFLSILSIARCAIQYTFTLLTLLHHRALFPRASDHFIVLTFHYFAFFYYFTSFSAISSHFGSLPSVFVIPSTCLSLLYCYILVIPPLTT